MARPERTGWTMAACTDVAPLASRKSQALKMVPPVAISSSTSRQSLPLMSPMTCAGRAFSSSPVRRLSMKAIGRSSRLAKRPASLASPTSAATTTVFDQVVLLEPLAQDRHARELIGGHREEALDLRRVQVDGQHAIGARGRHHVGHQARGDRDARLVLLVAARIREVRQHRGHALGRRMLERVEQDRAARRCSRTAAGRPSARRRHLPRARSRRS